MEEDFEDDKKDTKSKVKQNTETIKFVEPTVNYVHMTNETIMNEMNNYVKNIIKAAGKRKEWVNKLFARTSNNNQAIDLFKTLIYLYNTKQPKPNFETLIDDVCPDKVNTTFYPKVYDTLIEKEKLEIMNMERPVKVEEGIYKCKKCQSKKTHSYSVQLRRSDEPPTIFISCLNPVCRYEWRE
jgi:DNA-directed RNA polymerase subunit M/transcription elongation factor TFIIS